MICPESGGKNIPRFSCMYWPAQFMKQIVDEVMQRNEKHDGIGAMLVR